MSPATVFVRLALILGVLLQAHQAAAAHGSRLILPGLRQQDTAERVCRSFKICHNSKGAAWTTVQVFSAVEPLLTKLQLEPATDYVEVIPLQGCLSSGCCCSSPVEVRLSLPVHQDKRTAAAELASVKEFLQFRLPRELKDTACTNGQLGKCPPALSAEQRKLMLRKNSEDDMPPLPAGLIPYDGKKPAPEFEDDTTQAKQPAAASTSSSSSNKPKPQPQKAPTKAADDAAALDHLLPEGLIPYDHKTTRQLLEELTAEEEAAIAAVPSMAGGRILLESDSSTPGGYGGRLLLADVGGYGGRSLLSAVVAGGYGGRALLEQPAAAPKPDQQQKKQEAAKKQPAAAPSKDAKKPLASSSPAAPCSSTSSSSGSSSSLSPNGRPYGTCYCRYNPKDSTWAFEQAACRAALFSRCQSAGPLLDCSHVEAFYKGLAMPGSEPPHKDTLTAFLFTDCPPAPPCSCRGLVEDGFETPTARQRCCEDLQAHCAAPFSGLECEHVGRFCRPGRQSSDPVGALFSYVLVKTHGFDCSSPKYRVSYTSVVSSSNRPADGAAIRQQLSKAAALDLFSSDVRYDYSEPDRVAALLTMLIGGCFAVLVAAIGVAVIFRIVSVRTHHAAPLLERL